MGLESDKVELVHFVTFVFLERIPNKVFVARLLHVIGKKIAISMLVLMHLCNIQRAFHADRYLTLKSLYTEIVEKVSTYESLREPYIGFYPWICIMRETSDRCKHTLCDGITAPPSSSRTLSVSVESLMSSSSL